MCIILFHSQNCLGQDSAITNSWENLKTQLQRRTAIAISLTKSMSASKSVDKKELGNSKKIATDVLNYLDTLKKSDSLSIAMTGQKNNDLKQALKKVLASAEGDRKYARQAEFMNLIAQFEGAENRFVLARRQYNDVCKEHNRPDLKFLEQADAAAIKVEF